MYKIERSYQIACNSDNSDFDKSIAYFGQNGFELTSKQNEHTSFQKESEEIVVKVRKNNWKLFGWVIITVVVGVLLEKWLFAATEYYKVGFMIVVFIAFSWYFFKKSKK
ncbi:hypothetical protein GC194_09735 [bacterium]|nr:hypothetical protein [bacterium]